MNNFPRTCHWNAAIANVAHVNCNFATRKSVPDSTTANPPTENRVPRRWLVLLLLVCGIFLYLEVFVIPCIPRAAVGDQTVYLHDAARMFEGQLVFRDYDHFTFPGMEMLYLVLFKLFGVRAWIPQLMLVLIGLLLVWLSVKISMNLLGARAIFLPGLLFITLPFSGYLDATHHWYSTLCATTALTLLVKERTTIRLAWAGSMWGAATCLAQSQVVGVLGLALFLIWERHRKDEKWTTLLRKQAALFASYLGVVSAFAGYFVWKVGFRQFLYYTVTFVAKYYQADEPNRWTVYMTGWPGIHTRANWPDLPAWPLIHFIVPLIHILFFVRYYREGRLRPQVPWERLMLVNVTGLSLFLTVASAPTWNRLYTVSLPALIITVWFLNSTGRLERILSRGLWASALVLLLVKPIVTQARWKAFLDLPTGRTAFFHPALYEEVAWVGARTHPSDYFFGDQGVNFALRLRNPTRVAFVRPNEYTRPEEVRNVIGGLEENQVEFVSWYNGIDDSREGSRDPLGPLRRYLQDHYRVATSFSNGNKIWERKKQINVSNINPSRTGILQDTVRTRGAPKNR